MGLMNGYPHDSAPKEPVGFTVSQCYFVLALARQQAHRHGLAQEQVEDCACEFLCHLLVYRVRMPDAYLTEAWLRRCAENWILNFLRRERRLRRHEVCWSNLPETLLSARENLPLPSPSQGGGIRHSRPSLVYGKMIDCMTIAANSSEVALLRVELWEHLLAVIGRLTPAQRELVVARYVREERGVDIALASGRSVGAVNVALLSVRRTLRILLEQQGLDAVEAVDYLRLLARPGRPGERK